MSKKLSYLRGLKSATAKDDTLDANSDTKNIPNAVIVKNLPDKDWKSEDLQQFLQDEASSLTVREKSVTKFKGINHTALVFLKKKISDDALNRAVKKLQSSPFLGHCLELERLTQHAANRYLTLHNYKHPDEAKDELRRFFEDASLDSKGRRTYVVENVHVISFFALGYAVVKLTTGGDTEEVILPDLSSSEHIKHMEPWHVQFHRPLLLRMLADVKMEMQQEIDELKQTISDMKVAEAERTEKAKSEELQRMKRMAEDFEKDKSARMTIDLPAHKQPLLTDFAKTWRGCLVMLLENKILFYGQEEECKKAEDIFKRQIEALPEYTLTVDRGLLGVLETTKGQGYFKDLLRGHPDCFAVLDGTGIKCAALDDTQLQNLLSNFNRVFVERTCQVPTTLISGAPFKALKKKLKDTYLVKLVPQQDGSDVVVIHGVAEDVVRAAKEVDKFAYFNNPGRKTFCIPGALEGKACKTWFSKELDQVRKIIMKNGDISTDETTDSGYQLIFECNRDMLDQVFVKLNEIKYGIASSRVDLRKEFVQYRDRALVVNGLLSVGKETFLAVLKEKLREKDLTGLFDIIVPEHHNLPNLDVKQRGPPSLHSSTLSLAASLSDSTQVQESYVRTKNCKVSISDICIEKYPTDAALIFITNDLDMQKTSVGLAFCLAYPKLQEEVQQQTLSHREHYLIVLEPRKVNDNLTLMLAVLGTHLTSHSDIEGLVTEALQHAEKNELTSISMVPLGVGNRFNYDCRKVAQATVDAITRFDQSGPKFLKEIVVISQSHETTTVFLEVMGQQFGPIETPAGQEASAGNTETATRRFEALICTPTHRNFIREVTEILIEELNVTFLWHETIRDLETFKQLDDVTLQEITETASEKNVLLSKSDKGLRLCGQKSNVHELKAQIMEKIIEFVAKKSKEELEERRKCGLPVNTDTLPSYWAEGKEGSTYETAIRKWNQAGTHTVEVTAEERKAVEKVFLDTWEAGYTSRAVQVVKVERLENPGMWRSYSYKRELLFSDLVQHQQGQSSASYTQVENLVGSRGPVMTTLNIDKTGPLAREIYPQVNEHYFFHGTKKEVLLKIFSQGLDFRLAAGGLLGRGVYGAESSKKSDQYVGYGHEFSMLLVRMLLGEPYINKKQSAERYDRPPCMNCQDIHTRCRCVDAGQYNSVVDDAKSFREFVVYDRDVCYPEYVITYRRV